MRSSHPRVIVFTLVAISLVPAAGSAQAARGMLVSTDWVAAHLKAPHLVILDAETQRKAYEEGHVPGARFLDMEGLMWPGDPPVGAQMRPPAAVDSALEAAGVSDGDHIVVYGTDPLVSARAWVTLDVMGLAADASMMDGGMGAWRQEGRPVSTGAMTPEVGKLTLRPRAGVVVDADWLKRRLDDTTLTILDARTRAEYAGAKGGAGGKLHAGHVPGAYDLDWQTLIESRAVPRLLPRARLDSLVRASGAPAGSTVVTYCQTGVRASFDYFVARLLGYDVKLYDGSWRDWGSRDLPYVTGTKRR